MAIALFQSQALKKAFNSYSERIPLTHSVIASKITSLGSPSFTRATTKYILNNDGYMVQIKAGEVGFEGARRIENLSASSEDLTTSSWSRNGTTVSIVSVADPLGGATANKVAVASTASELKEVTPNNKTIVAGNKYAHSGYYKANELRYIQMLGTGTIFGTFIWNIDLATGTETLFTAGTSTITNRTIESVDNGWYRISYTALAIASGSGNCNGGTLIPNGTHPRVNAWAGNVGDSIYYDCLQFENVTGQATQTAGEYVSNGAEKLNVLMDTNDFSTANWSRTNITLTPNQLANPINGAANVQKISATATSATTVRSINNLAQSTTVTASAYVSTDSNLATLEFILRNGTTATNFTSGIFTVATGAISGAGWTSTAVPGAPGWCRVEYTRSTNISVNDFVSLYVGANAAALTAGDYWYVYGPQINSGATALDYYPVGNVYPFHGAMVDGVHYFDTDISGVSIPPTMLLGYLSGPSRANLFLQSQTFDNASWAKTDTTVTADATAAPDGTLTADLLAEGSAGTATTTQAVTGTANGVYVASFHIKYSNNPWVRLMLLNGANAVSGWFNIQTGAVGSPSVEGTGSIVGIEIFARANGFYRCVLIGSVGSGATAITARINGAPSNGSTSRTNGAAYYVWGAQFENNVGTSAFATSYIPTTTTSVTRNADVLTYDLPALTSGTVYCKGSIAGALSSATHTFVCLDDNTANNRITLSGLPAAGAQDTTQAEILNAGVSTAQININSSSLLSQRKTAISFATNVIDAATDGTLGTQDTSSAIPSTTKLRVGSTSAAQSLCNVCDVRIYRTRQRRAALTR